MVTKKEAMEEDRFHYGECTLEIGARGGKKYHIEEWRRNGRTQTWKTRPNEFRVPIKYGMYDYSAITESNAGDFHVARHCKPKVVSNKTQLSLFDF